MDPNQQTPAPPEKDRYTYDEMMDRLRGQRSGSGGTRRVKVESPDGTVEVRKRKRRSHQPKKVRLERISRLKKIAIIGGIVLVLLAIGAKLLLKVRYQSDGFRKGVSDRASEVIGAPVTLDPLNIKGFTARSRKLVIDPPPQSILRDAEFISLTGKLTAGSLVSPDWHLTSLESVYAKLRFHAPGPSLRAALPTHAPEIPLVTAGLGFSGKPDHFDIDQVRVNSADLIWSGGRKDFVFLKEASLWSSRIGSRTQLKVSSGQMKLIGWPDFDLESAVVDFGRNEIQVEEASLSHKLLGKEGGTAMVNGSIDLTTSSPIANFICQLDGVPAISLVEDVWRTKLVGEVEATLNFQADLSTPGSLEVSGSFEIHKGSIGGIDPTKRLSAFLAEPRMSRINFHSITGKITLANGTRTVEEIDAQAPDFVHVGGSYSISPEGVLTGTLLVGISDKVLNEMPGGKPDFFGATDAVTAMSSTTVQLGGTSAAPTEDLTPRLEAAIEKFKLKSAAPPASSYPTIPVNPRKKTEAEKRAEAAFDKLIEP